MGRLKTRLATSPQDQQLQGHLADAERALEKAMNVCRQASNGQEGRRGREMLRVIGTAVNIIQNAGHLTPMIDLSDPDLQSEDARSAAFHKALASRMSTATEQQLRAARQSHKKAAPKPPDRRPLYQPPPLEETSMEEGD